MRRLRSLTPIIAFLLAGLLLAGCAGTARGVKQSVYGEEPAHPLIDVSRSEADALVVIRYPAVVDDDAAAAFYMAFERHAIGGAFEPEPELRQHSDRIAESLLAKSNYFAMTLYRELRDRLPPDSVLLSPHEIELNAEGSLVSRPLLAAEQVPSVLTIDFSVYSHPDPRRMMDAEPLTFGDLVTPLFVVHANRWLRPSTYGLLLSSEPLLDAAWLQSGRQAEAEAAARFDGRVAEQARPLDFVMFLNGAPAPRSQPPVKDPGERQRATVAVEAHPLEKIRMDADTVALLHTGPTVDPFAAAFVQGAATRVVAALNRAEHDRATFFTRQTALAQFDPELGRALLARSRAEEVQARLRMAEALLKAERKFLSAQSASLYGGAYEGDYGGQMRQMIAAEYRLLEERRDLARRQNLGAALAIVALAGAMYIGSETDASDFFESPTMENILLLSSVWAVNSAFTANAQSKTIGENFLAQMAPAVNRQVTVQVEWLESREQITAGDFSEFREQTLALYQRSVRSLQTGFDAECVFRHPALDTDGRWYGGCADGLAAGNGYGVVVTPDGYFLEFVGGAAGGLAEGSGALIFRSPADRAPVFYEGGFRAGLPDGVVKIEEAGRQPRVRVFDMGRDRGAGDPEDLHRVVF